MSDTIPVNFHSHSIFSDGGLTPETLAANLAAAGVRYAALTDHDSLEGLARFQEALKKRGIGYLTGVELTAYYNGREVHLLGYGFDPEDPDLVATLLSLRQTRDVDVHSIAVSLRKSGANRTGAHEPDQAVSAAPNGLLTVSRAIELIHRAGGKVFLAHPLLFENDMQRLEVCVADLKAKGLDGIEALYSAFSQSECDELCRLAQKYDLLVSAGTDFHLVNGKNLGTSVYVINMPRSLWVQFRAAVFTSPTFAARSDASPDSPADQGVQPPSGKPHHFRRRSYILRIFLPTLIAIGLFLSAIWGIILPSFEQILLDRKREMIRELTNSAWSILSSYARDEQNNRLTREQAQLLAIARIEALRYGPEGKDYFWIQDMTPRMIMHPYRSDLNGEDLTSFTDPRGVPIFVEFAELVRKKGEGYIDYVWQWKDDPARLEPKESYVKGFEPWGWVIGTGIYTDDVNAEIARIEQNLINTSLVISGGMILLLLFVLQQSLRIERERQDVLDSLRESTERYYSLVEATTEGTLLILEGRCRYANPTFLRMVGYTARQLEFIDLADLFPLDAGNQAIWRRLEQFGTETLTESEAFDGVLRHADGHLLECVLMTNPIVFAGQRGFILLARDISRSSALLGAEAIFHAAQSVPVGIFRARAARRATMIEMNPAARAYFSQSQPALADLFSDPTEFDALMQRLQREGEIRGYVLHLETHTASTHYLSLSARWVNDEGGSSAFIDGVIEDVTALRKQEAAREALIERLQTSLLFLHEPISSLGRDVIICDMNTTISQLTRLMTQRNRTAALVSMGSPGTVVGIITDHDLRARVLAGSVALDKPIHTIMSAPLIKISETASIYEALMQMEENGVRHLAVQDLSGQIVNVIDNKALVQFQRYGPVVLAREISHAPDSAEVARFVERTPLLAKALIDSSARPRYVTRMLTTICDAATARLIQLAIEDLGNPPASFAWIAMGSQGRQEQTLVTDQDNGIIYAPVEGGDAQAVNHYFLRLGKWVCDGLHQAGYAHCRGGVMASNPRWCRALPEWITGFHDWVNKSEPQEIIDLSIFFDLRTVYAEDGLTAELRRIIHASLNGQDAFFHHFAQNALAFKPPFRLLGNIYLGGGATEHSGEINLKDAMMPVVSFARLYALRQHILPTHTLERIETLTDHNVLLPASRDEILIAYDFLMQLRLQNQIAAIQAGRPPTNLIHPSRLGYIQQELLKQAFAQIAAVQKKIGFDFGGGS